MPTFDLRQILYPRPKKDNLAKQMKDLISVFLSSKDAPSSEDYEKAIDMQEDILNQTTNETDRIKIQKEINRLEQELRDVMIKEATLDIANLEKLEAEKISEAEEKFANSPYDYVEAMWGFYRKMYDAMEKMKEEIPERTWNNFKDIDKFEEIKNNYKTRAEDLSGFRTAIREKNETELKYYGIFYNSSSKGIINIWAGPTAKQPSGYKSTNLKSLQGIPVYIFDPKPLSETSLKRINFGNQELIYVPTLGKFHSFDVKGFSWESVKKKNALTTGWGDFLVDSRGDKYFVGEGSKFVPISDEQFVELGGKTEKLQRMTKEEEFEILPTRMTTPIEPMRDKIKKYMEESVFMGWEAEKAAEKAKFPAAIFPWAKPKPPVMPFAKQLAKARLGVKRILPPREKEAIIEREAQILKGEFK